MLIREYYEQLNAHKFDNLDELKLERHNLPKLTKGEIDHQNKPITTEENE